MNAIKNKKKKVNLLKIIHYYLVYLNISLIKYYFLYKKLYIYRNQSSDKD